ncbi:hypothetical protein GF318_04980 [Candidatus Micrarchaeota archaeon]|nr:hypothetical protein [Candidatus Micrarchaeota archaeon]
MNALLLLLLALGLLTFGCCCAVSDIPEGDYEGYDFEDYQYESDAPVPGSG